MAVFRGHEYGIDGLPKDPKTKLAPDDHKLFVAERTREIRETLSAKRPNARNEELFDAALKAANAELRAALRSKKRFWWQDKKPKGRPRGKQSRGLPNDSTLQREYQIARQLFHSLGGKAYSAVASYLWRKKYYKTGISCHALRVRLGRAMKKLEHK